jgi:hypothetical protein
MGQKKQSQNKPNLETAPGGPPMSDHVFNPREARDNLLDLGVLIWYNMRCENINSMEI